MIIKTIFKKKKSLDNKKPVILVLIHSMNKDLRKKILSLPKCKKKKKGT